MATKTFKIGLSNTDKQNMAQDVYERVLDLTFPEYETTASYSVGDFVVYNDQLYKCIGATSGAWDSTKWQLATLNDLLTDIESAVAYVNDKANVDGNYPTMTVGLADNLTPYSEDSGDEQDEPFILQGTGCGNGTEIVTTGDYALLKEKQGNTVVVNQIFNTANFPATQTINGVTFTNNGDGSITVSGLATADAFVSYRNTSFGAEPNQKCLLMGCPSGGSDSTYYMYASAMDAVALLNIKDTGNGAVGYSSSRKISGFNIYIKSGTDMGTGKKFVPRLVNLDQWGFTADEIADITAHPENFFRYYNGSLAYNAGSLETSDGRYLECTGRNLFDGTNDIKTIPNAIYYILGIATITYKDLSGNTIGSESKNNTTFTTPSNCASFGVSGSGDITITPYYPPEEGGEGYDQYYPYEEPFIVDTGSETLLSAGSGSNITRDYKLPSGVIYRLVGTRAYASGDENDTTLSTDGTTTNYPLANEDIYTEQGTPFSPNLKINDYGQMGWLNSSNNPVSIPQGNLIFYPANYTGFVDDVYSRTSGDASNIVIQSELTASETERDTVDTQLQNAIGGTLRQLLASSQSIDFLNTAFIDLGTLTWDNPGTAYGVKEYNSGIVSGIKIPADNNTVPKIICSSYKENKRTAGVANCIMVASDGSILITEQGTYTRTEFKAKMKGVLLAYEKASS